MAASTIRDPRTNSNNDPESWLFIVHPGSLRFVVNNLIAFQQRKEKEAKRKENQQLTHLSLFLSSYNVHYWGKSKGLFDNLTL